MELSSQEEEMPIPINSTYGGGHGHGHGHMIHHHHHLHHDHSAPHNHIISTTTPPQIASNTNNNNNINNNGPLAAALSLDDHNNNNNNNVGVSVGFKKMVRYRECLKNHAAAMGGNATDGCGEFMPSGEEGTIEALTCSACSCHRNFHRKEIEGEPSTYYCDCYQGPIPNNNRMGRKLMLGHHHKAILGPESLGYPTPTGTLISSRAAVAAAPQMIMSYNNMGSLPSESDEQEEGGFVARPITQMAKKRFRTKFSQEQKEKMFNFAEKVGWKIQKQEEAVVQQFCQEVGVKRRVLKVWMHNNKHNLAKKIPSTAQTQNEI